MTFRCRNLTTLPSRNVSFITHCVKTISL
uniref:DWF4 n=1 Tax=Arundo donax TaxID=35708 RepID=A0A0A9MSY0_ARUDO